MTDNNKLTGCSCPQCVSACRNDPGRLVPDDLPALAALLGLSIEELIVSCLVKIPIMGREKIYALAPAKRKGKRLLAAPGTVVPGYYVREKGTCIFLDETGMCTVHQAKPFECGAYMGCKNTFMGRPYKEKQVEEYFYQRWKGYRFK